MDETKPKRKPPKRTPQQIEAAAAWVKASTKQYLLRFMNATGVPEAVEKASAATGEAPSEYMKAAIVKRLKDEGFLENDIVMNANKQRHKDKVERLARYVEEERKKMKK